MRALFILLLIGMIACKKDPEPYSSIGNSGWTYTGENADVNATDDIIVDFDIKNNLNVDGQAEISGNTSIGNNINLNDGAKIIVNVPWENDTVYVNGNVNLNDSLLVKDGFLWIRGNLNINSGGIINVSDFSSMFVQGNINNSGALYGYRNVSVGGSLQQNGGSTTTQAPL